MDWRLAVGVHVDGQDMSARFQPRLVSLALTDEAGAESDRLEVVLAIGHAGSARMAFPRMGAQLTVFLGHGFSAAQMGVYVCDDVEASGPPDVMVIRASAAVLDGSGRASAMQTGKTRSWEAGTTLGALVGRIASDHGLRPVVAASLASVPLEHIDQVDESDMNLLLRVARDRDAVFKPAGGALVLAKRGESVSGSGKPLAVVQLARGDISSWRVARAKRDAAGKAVATWRDLPASKDEEATAGDGDGPVLRLRHKFTSAAEAGAAAEAAKGRADRSEMTLSLVLPGRADLQAEGRLVLAGVYPEADREWLVKSVRHSVDASSGWQTAVDAELPDAVGQGG